MSALASKLDILRALWRNFNFQSINWKNKFFDFAQKFTTAILLRKTLQMSKIFKKLATEFVIVHLKLKAKSVLKPCGYIASNCAKK